MNLELNAEPRRGGSNKALRRRGRIPAVVYGKQMANEPIHVEEAALLHVLRAAKHPLVALRIASGDTVNAMVTEVQRDPLRGQVLHVDFHQVNLHEFITAEVPLHVVGEPEDKNAIVQVQMHDIEVRCLPTNMPAVIAVNLTGWKAGDTLTAGELILPDGVELKSRPDEVVVTLLEPRMPAKEDHPEADAGREEAAKTAVDAEAKTSV